MQTRSNLANLAPFAAAAAVAAAARRVRALSCGGAVASTGVGGAVVSGAGILGGVGLLAFFASSTLLGRLPRPPRSPQRRGNERDAVQVLANGGVAAAMSLAMAVLRNTRHAVLLAGLGGALAAATADTWGTEIGSRASIAPRSILSGKRVPTGTSGGVSVSGLLGSAAGAAMIAAIFGFGATQRSSDASPIASSIAVGGVCGALVDSVLGASVQEVRRCQVCGVETELLKHECGQVTDRVRGIPGFNNDAVNFVATLAGALTALTIARTSVTRLTGVKR